MPLRIHAQREVMVRRPAPGRGGYAFAPQGTPVQADVQPMNGDMSERMYGVEPELMRRMLAASGADIRPGDGVSVSVSADADPDYRAVYVAKWTRHTEAHLRYIPPAQRGPDA